LDQGRTIHTESPEQTVKCFKDHLKLVKR
jgi:hypothetical protein